MGSATKAERDAFKTAVEQFTDRWELVLMENDNPVETRRQNIAEYLEVARLQNSLTFQLDDDGPIPSLDAPRSAPPIRTNWSGTPTSSIALASRLNNKRKRYSNQSASSCAEPSADALLLANACRDGMAVLANALLASQNPEPASAAASTSYSLQSLEQRMDRMDKIEARVGKLQDMVKQVLEAVQRRHAAVVLEPPIGDVSNKGAGAAGDATESTNPATYRDPSSWAGEKDFDKSVSYAVGGASGGA